VSTNLEMHNALTTESVTKIMLSNNITSAHSALIDWCRGGAGRVGRLASRLLSDELDAAVMSLMN